MDDHDWSIYDRELDGYPPREKGEPYAMWRERAKE